VVTKLEEGDVMHRVRLRQFLRPVTLAAALVGFTMTLATAPAAAEPTQAGFMAESKVTTLESRISVQGASSQQASPPESFCYVNVNGPTFLPDQRATATWSLDCRSLANPNLPAPDIDIVGMEVRVFRGEFNPFEPGILLGGMSCTSGRTDPSCTATTENPVPFGTAVFSRFDVTVQLRGGTTQVGAFVTPSVRQT
jgi:hypothetical protein